MPREHCHRHGEGNPCSCAMGNLYRYVEPITLFLLKEKSKAHGYELIKGINEHSLTDSVVEPGALYRTLRRLEDNNYVTSTWDTSNAGPAKRIYELTPDGEEHLREWIIVLEQLAKQMQGFVKDAAGLFQPADKVESHS